MTFLKQTKIKTWKGIRNLINVSKNANTNIDKIIENGKETTKPAAIAEALNHFYKYRKVC